MADVGDLVKMTQAKKAGMPLAWKSIHTWLKTKEFTDLEFDEELELIGEEDDDDRLSGPDDGLGEGEGDIDPITGLPVQPAGQGSDADADEDADQE